MKKFIFLFTALILTGFTVNADTTNADTNTTYTFYRGYGNSFIFVEGGIEFSIFRDGQFDFNLLRNNSRLNVSIGTRNTNISFNSGFDYDPFVQYDDYGAVVQIEKDGYFYSGRRFFPKADHKNRAKDSFMNRSARSDLISAGRVKYLYQHIQL